MSSEWPTYRFDVANTGVTPDQGPGADYTVRWKTEVGATGGDELVVSDNRLYATLAGGVSDGTIRAFDATSGEHLWSGRHDYKDRYTAPTVADGLVWATNLDFQPLLEAFRASDGTVAREYEMEGVNYQRIPLVVSDETVFAATDFRYQAFETDRSGRRWEYESNQRITGLPALSEDTIYVGSVDRSGEFKRVSDSGRVRRIRPSILALDTTDGSLRWRRRLPASPHYLAVRDGLIFGLTSAYDRGGEPYEGLWAITGSDEPFEVADFGRPYSVVVALDTSDGSFRWTTDLDADISVSNGLAVGREAVFVGTEDGVVLALDVESGRVEWKTDLPGSVHHPPTVASDTVYIGTETGLVGMNRQTGEVGWRYSTEDRINTSVSVAEGSLFFGDRGGTIYSLTRR